MFSYCMNSPVNMLDTTGENPWVIVGVFAISAVVGGLVGWFTDHKLWEAVKSKDSVDSSTPAVTSKKKETNNLPQKSSSAPKNNHSKTQIKEAKLTTGDRILNAAIGSSIGLACGGVIVSGAAVVGTLAVGSATVVIPLFGATGAQTFAFGALAYDAFAMIIAPFLGVEVEPIEYAE